LELIVAGTKDAVLMVESEASGLTEKIMLDAVKFGHEQFGPVIKMINEFSSECSKEKWIVEEKDLNEVKSNLLKNVKNDLVVAFSEADKKKRGELINLANH
jgi:polyribonucleotide nucleotidyltransferase